MVIFQLKSKVMREPMGPMLSPVMATRGLIALASDLAKPVLLTEREEAGTLSA